jgi:hypothetical protein
MTASLSSTPPSSRAARREKGPDSGHFDNGLEHIALLGMDLAACSEAQLLDALFGALGAQHGGGLITANLDFLRRY